ncbi:ABC-type dipeptide/oligopeptide/nickel transport systems, permease components [Anaerolinea thermolimosa]|uniref:ABC transporter permease n=1 Tax=Anaerolinea thermolimosa TaxID=229919 RepID=UPI00078124A8|nr:ABC transporter permease [Anaerolinea thermolimosa]GAP06803.1 ABC-type dipeptide/oligopeptide/nickel transport systems, permease components [Anaerolinea thermolimosa]
MNDELGKKLFDDQGVIGQEHNEGYFQLVWRRFRRSKVSIVGSLMVLTLLILAIFADFFSPTSIYEINLQASFIPPQRVRFIDHEGKFHLRPFVYNYVYTLDPKTFKVLWMEDTTKAYFLRFFVKGPEYKILGLIPSNLHLYGVEEGGTVYILGTDKMGRDLWGKACEAGRISLSMSLFGTIISIAVGSILGVASGYYGGWIDSVLQRFTEFISAFPNLPLWMALAALVPKTADSFTVFIIMACIFALLSWTTLAREVRAKVMSLRETDFILAAKEMGASDARIIFRHLYPNTLSHIIVILTLTIPGVILAESFLSFLGIGITEPLISWGLMMRNTQDIQTLGQNAWILSPIGFMVVAVLGFNFLGDGLRDAADPYAAM